MSAADIMASITPVLMTIMNMVLMFKLLSMLFELFKGVRL